MTVKVIETWYLDDEARGNATEVLKEMDDRLEDNTHAHPGWRGHATFLQDIDEPHLVTWIYDWASREQHEDLMRTESEIVAELQRAFCVRPRVVRYVEELPVEVEDH